MEELYPIGCYVWYTGTLFTPGVYEYVGPDVDISKFRLRCLEKNKSGFRIVFAVRRDDFRMATASEVLFYTKDYDEGKIFRLTTRDDS